MRKTLRSWQCWSILTAVLVGGFVMRLLMAPYVVNGDAVITQQWMESAVKLGFAASYDSQVNGGMLPAYPPISMYLFYATGFLYKLLISPEYLVVQPAHLVFVKLPAMMADIGIALVLFLLLRHWKRPIAGLIAAAAFALHPAAIYNSTMWGQTDGIFTFFVLLSLYAFVRGGIASGIGIITLACFVKPQAIAFLPLAVCLVPLQLKPILRSIVAAGAVLLVACLPFLIHGNIESLIRVYGVFDLMGETRVSWNAYNMWWMFLGPQALNITGGTTMVAGISYRLIGLVLFAGTVLGTLWLLRNYLRSATFDVVRGQAIMLAATVSASAFFLFNAEMHERYHYPYIALALPLAFIRPRLAVIYVCTSLGYLFNMLGVFPYGAIDRFFFARIPNFSVLIAVSAIALFCLTLPFVFFYKERVIPFLGAQAGSKKRH